VPDVVCGDVVRDRDLESTHFYNMSRVNRGFVVRGCRMGPHRRHGTLTRSVEGLIEGNTIEGVTGSAVAVGNEMGGFYEGPFPREITIRGNTLRRCRRAPVDIYSLSVDGTAELTRDITIERNQIELREGQQAAIEINRAKNVIVRDNRVTDAHERVVADTL
jgi:hypothetical protein